MQPPSGVCGIDTVLAYPRIVSCINFCNSYACALCATSPCKLWIHLTVLSWLQLLLSQITHSRKLPFVTSGALKRFFWADSQWPYTHGVTGEEDEEPKFDVYDDVNVCDVFYKVGHWWDLDGTCLPLSQQYIDCDTQIMQVCIFVTDCSGQADSVLSGEYNRDLMASRITVMQPSTNHPWTILLALLSLKNSQHSVGTAFYREKTVLTVFQSAKLRSSQPVNQGS